MLVLLLLLKYLFGAKKLPGSPVCSSFLSVLRKFEMLRTISHVCFRLKLPGSSCISVLPFRSFLAQISGECAPCSLASLNLFSCHVRDRNIIPSVPCLLYIKKRRGLEHVYPVSLLQKSKIHPGSPDVSSVEEHAKKSIFLSSAGILAIVRTYSSSAFPRPKLDSSAFMYILNVQ